MHVNLSGEDPERLEEVVKSFIQNRCLTNGGSKAYEELEESIETSPLCVWNALVFDGLETEDEIVHAICTDVRPRLHSCIVLVLDKLEPCLDKDEKYFPNFVSGRYNSTFDLYCEDNGKTLKDYIDDRQKLKCEAMDGAHKGEVLEKCFSKSSVIKDFKIQDFVITKEILCGYLQHGNECLLNYLKENCDEDVHKAFQLNLEPTKMWCDKFVNDVD